MASHVLRSVSLPKAHHHTPTLCSFTTLNNKVLCLTCRPSTHHPGQWQWYFIPEKGFGPRTGEWFVLDDRIEYDSASRPILIITIDRPFLNTTLPEYINPIQAGTPIGPIIPPPLSLIITLAATQEGSSRKSSVKRGGHAKSFSLSAFTGSSAVSGLLHPPSPKSPSPLGNVLSECEAFGQHALTLSNLDELRTQFITLANGTFHHIMSLDDVELVQFQLRQSISSPTFPERPGGESPLRAADPLLYSCVENYLHDQTYEIVFFKICAHYKAQDEAFLKSVEPLYHLDFEQVGANRAYAPHFQLALKAFQRLGIERTPLEKLACLIKTVYALQNKANGNSGVDDTHSLWMSKSTPTSGNSTRPTSSPSHVNLMSTDDLIPLLVLIICKSKVTNLEANLYYITHYVQSYDVSGGEYGFILSSFEAVLIYMKNNSHILLAEIDPVDRMLEILQRGDLNELCEWVEFSTAQALKPPPPSSSAFTPPTPRMQGLLRYRDGQGNPLTFICCRYNHVSILSYLLVRLEQSTMETNELGQSILHICVLTNAYECAEYLIFSQQCPLEVQDQDGNTPLLLAAQLNQPQMVTLLKQAGCCVSTCNLHGNHALYLANQLPIFRGLCESLPGTSSPPVRTLPTLEHMLTHVNQEGMTPLLYHLNRGHLAIVEYLLDGIEQDHGVKVDFTQTDLGFRTMLHVASHHGHTDILCSILKKDAEASRSGAREAHVSILDKATFRKNTALHAACDAGKLECVQALCSYGANPTLRNMQGMTAVDLARTEEMRGMLEDYWYFEYLPQKQGSVNLGMVRRACIVYIYPKTLEFVLKSQSLENVPILDLDTPTSKTNTASLTSLRPPTSPILSVRRKYADFKHLCEWLKHHTSGFIPESMDTMEEFANHAKMHPRLIKRLNRFLEYVNGNPNLQRLPIIEQFFSLSLAEWQDYFLAHKHSIPDHLISSPALGEDEAWEQDMKFRTSPIYTEAKLQEYDHFKRNYEQCLNGVKTLGSLLRQLGGLRKELAFTFRDIKYHMCRLTCAILPSPPPRVVPFEAATSCKEWIGDRFRMMHHLTRLSTHLQDLGTAEIWEIGDFFLEYAYYYPSVIHALASFYPEAVRIAHQFAHKDLKARQALTRAQTSASSMLLHGGQLDAYDAVSHVTPHDEKEEAMVPLSPSSSTRSLRRLEEASLEALIMSKEVRKRQCHVVEVESALDAEQVYFATCHRREWGRVLNAYAAVAVQQETHILEELEGLLAAG